MLRRVEVYDHTAGSYVDIHDPSKCAECRKQGWVGGYYDADEVDAELARLRAIEAAARRVVSNDGYSLEDFEALRAALGKQ